MAVRNVVLKTGEGPDAPAVTGEIRIRRYFPGAKEDGTYIHATDKRVALTYPASSVELETGIYYTFTPVRPLGKQILALIPSGSGDLLFKDLVPLDPSSLEPSASPEPAWFAALDDLDASLDAKIATGVNALGTSANPVTNAAAARPTGLTVVYWRTATAPTNAVNGDHWEQVV